MQSNETTKAVEVGINKVPESSVIATFSTERAEDYPFRIATEDDPKGMDEILEEADAIADLMEIEEVGMKIGEKKMTKKEAMKILKMDKKKRKKILGERKQKDLDQHNEKTKRVQQEENKVDKKNGRKKTKPST